MYEIYFALKDGIYTCARNTKQEAVQAIIACFEEDENTEYMTEFLEYVTINHATMQETLDICGSCISQTDHDTLVRVLTDSHEEIGDNVLEHYCI